MDDPFYDHIAFTAESICLGPPASICDSVLLEHFDGDFFNKLGTIYGLYIDEGIDAHFTCDMSVDELLIGYLKLGPGGVISGGIKKRIYLRPEDPFDVSLRAVAPLPFADIGFILTREQLEISSGSTFGPCMLYVK